MSADNIHALIVEVDGRVYVLADGETSWVFKIPHVFLFFDGRDVFYASTLGEIVVMIVENTLRERLLFARRVRDMGSVRFRVNDAYVDTGLLFNETFNDIRELRRLLIALKKGKARIKLLPREELVENNIENIYYL